MRACRQYHPLKQFGANEVVQTCHGQLPHLPHVLVAFGGNSLGQPWPQHLFHDIKAAEGSSYRKKAICDLVKDRVLCIEIIDLDTPFIS